MAGQRYGAILVASTIALVGAAVIAYARLAARPGGALLARTGEASDTFAVHGVRDIAPDRSAYARFAVEDSIWRARNDRMLLHWETAGGAVWHPSARQLVLDSAFFLVRDARLADAAALLGRWLGAHPADTELRVERARLLAQSGHLDEAIAEYRRAAGERPHDRALGDEYAAALLQARRYDEAARMYRALIALDPNSLPYRMGLARALAWGPRPREAEPVLAALLRSRPGDAEVLEMLHSVRASYDPTPPEAERWVAGEPRYLPYRLAYARALAAAGRSVQSAAQFDSVLAHGETVPLLREAAGVHAAIPDSVGSARLLGRAVALAASDTSLRREYAKSLAWAGDRRGAIEQLSILLAGHADAGDLLLRGQLYLWSGDQARAESDLVASARLSPRRDTFILLADMRRWRGDWRGARAVYRQALALWPGDPALLGGLALLDREERLATARPDDEIATGWVATAHHLEDNTGYLYLSAGIARGFAVGRGTALTIGAEQRRVSQRTPHGSEQWLYGFAVEGGAEHFFQRLRVAARAGVARHALAADLPYGSASVSAPLGRTQLSLSASDGPVYNTLMTTRALVPVSPDGMLPGRPLTGRELTASAATPVGRAELYLSAGALRLSDGNERRTVQASARLPLGSHLAALYSGGALGFSERSSAYWNPSRYVSNAIGLEAWLCNPRGFSATVRVLPGYGRSDETVMLADGPSLRIPPRAIPQLSAGYEAGYRARRWRVLVDGSYGRGREGGYQSLTSNARFQVDW